MGQPTTAAPRPLPTQQVQPPTDRTGNLLRKVPEVLIYFWIIKILATTVGETAADYLNVNLNFGTTGTTVIMSVLLIGALAYQIYTRSYRPVLYWLVVVLMSVVGTLITDNMVDNLGISLQDSTIGFAIALIATFIAWWVVERSLSIHSIRTRRREMFYWLVILFTFALGTAGGDLAAEQLGLGYLLSVVLFAAIIGILLVLHTRFGLNAIVAFWAAYILTRPLGASLGDLLSQSTDDGGLGLGTVATSAIFLAAIAGLVVFLILTRKDAPVIDADEATADADQAPARHALTQAHLMLTQAHQALAHPHQTLAQQEEAHHMLAQAHHLLAQAQQTLARQVPPEAG